MGRVEYCLNSPQSSRVRAVIFPFIVIIHAIQRTG